MTAVLLVVVVAVLGLVITRVATIAFVLTGMSPDAARFQARSALTGTGFTTGEAEAVVTHPARRRIVMVLMLLGGAGAVSAVGAVVLGFAGVDTAAGGLLRVGVLLGSLLVLLWVAQTDPVDRLLERLIRRVLRRWTDLEVRDYTALLHLRGPWRISRVRVGEGDRLASRPLDELGLTDDGVTVLGIEHADGRWDGAPAGDAHLRAGDEVLLYGTEDALVGLGRRPGP
ncbi:TrkA C-terminal domain-containing protein [Aquipuribacter nitratireducens]|uniref:TrkA C-terminal domain-containing protein n=1 Tax=Aquipuribacter nitratireducens TaxID=650104 RepID=A0ABW0GRK7_9MICO